MSSCNLQHHDTDNHLQFRESGRKKLGGEGKGKEEGREERS